MEHRPSSWTTSAKSSSATTDGMAYGGAASASLLSTLLLHDGGAARIFGHDAFTETRAVRRLINRVSVEASFFKKMSAVENLSYAARFYGMPIRETRRRIPEILERVGFPKARLIELGSADELKRKHGAKTLEEAFFAATGKAFEDELPEEDE